MRQNSLVRASNSLSEESFKSSYDYAGQNGSTDGISTSEGFGTGSTGKAKNKSIPDDDFRLLQSYFKEVGTESLLSAEQECHIATKIKKPGLPLYFYLQF